MSTVNNSKRAGTRDAPVVIVVGAIVVVVDDDVNVAYKKKQFYLLSLFKAGIALKCIHDCS